MFKLAAKMHNMDSDQSLRAKSVLIVEDEYFIASDLAKVCTSAGLQIVGPVASAQDGQKLADAEPIDLALLDINLSGGMVYDLADTLIARGVRIAFLTGYDAIHIPDRYRDVPYYRKPVAMERFIDDLARGIS